MSKVQLPPGYEVVKDSYEIPCDHPMCATLHRHLAKEPFSHGGYEWVWVATPGRGEQKQVRVNRWHNLVREQWVILLHGQRVGDAHDTKREAVAEAVRFQPTI